MQFGVTLKGGAICPSLQCQPHLPSHQSFTLCLTQRRWLAIFLGRAHKSLTQIIQSSPPVPFPPHSYQNEIRLSNTILLA